MKRRTSPCLRTTSCPWLATMRSRNIFCSYIAQNMAQIKALFKEQWESLVGLCDEFLYLGGNEKETHKYVSELMGKETLDRPTPMAAAGGRSGSFSVNDQQSGTRTAHPGRGAAAGQPQGNSIRPRANGPCWMTNMTFMLPSQHQAYARTAAPRPTITHRAKDAAG